MAIWRMRIACWIPKATNKHSEYVIHIACPLQQWLHERPSMLRYTYIDCILFVFISSHLAVVCCWLQIRATPTILPYMTTRLWDASSAATGRLSHYNR